MRAADSVRRRLVDSDLDSVECLGVLNVELQLVGRRSRLDADGGRRERRVANCS